MTAVTCQRLLASQLLASLGGHQLEPCSVIRELEPASVATLVFKCDHRKVNREQCPLAPVGLPVACDIDTQLAWRISCLQPPGKDIMR